MWAKSTCPRGGALIPRAVMEPRNRFADFFGYWGYTFLQAVSNVLNGLAFFYDCWRVAFTYRRTGRKVIRKIIRQQIYFTAIQSLFVLGVLAALLGALVVIQGFGQLSRVGGAELLDSFLVIFIIREVGPIMTAFFVILRSGVAISIETGYMSVLKEIEALAADGIDPLHYIAFPRLVGMTVSVLALFIYFDLCAVVGGYFFGWLLADIPFSNIGTTFPAAIGTTDLMAGLFKGLGFGLIISTVSLYLGMQAEKGVTQIPPQTSKASVYAFLLCFVWNLVISAVLYMV